MRGELRSRIWLLSLLCAIVFTYAFYFTAGKFKDAPMYNNYYDLLADGFRSGHLYLAAEPDPRLLAQKNPYNYAHQALWLGDTSLYAGKFYLYWGPVPALLQALVKSALRIEGMIGDQYLTFAFLSGSALLGALLFDRITRRLFDGVPRWLTLVGIATFAFANPVVYLIATPGVYQAAITGGQMFALAGLLFAFDAVWESFDRPPSSWRLVLAGSAFACALGCRISLGPCISLLVATTALATSRPSETRLRSLLRNATYLGAPVAIGLLAILSYNKARFHEWFEFGTHWQLTTVPLRVSTDYVLANLYEYTISPFGVSCQFPYALQSWETGPKGLPSWVSMPNAYQFAEPVTGFLRAAPITWLLPFALAVAIRCGLELRRAPLPDAQRLSSTDRQRLGYLWCAACFALLGSASGAVTLGFYFATMRYLGDVSFGLIGLSLLGGYALFARTPPRLRRISASVMASLAGATMVLGLVLGYQGYNNQFKLFNPELDAKIVRMLSVCQSQPGSTASP